LTGKDLAASGEGADASGRVDSFPLVVVIVPSGFCFVDADADRWREAVLGTVASEGSLDSDRALDRRLGATKCHEESITGPVHLLSGVRDEKGSQRLVVPAEQVVPGLVSEDVNELGRSDDVGEEECPEHAKA
jgi:hypothetical protein